MQADQRVATLRDVLVRGLRDLAVQIASVDLSADEPTTEQVTRYVQALQVELDKARARGVVVPGSVSVYADPRMLAAANREAMSCMRLRLSDGSEVLFSPPPASYVMGSMAEEIERAAGEAVDTQKLPTMDAQFDTSAVT
jgi:chemotaxis response regulator CheB